jgi:hypothetical protein
MRPYLAIIVDSFRAAVASRVLYIMLLLITVLFLLICPWNIKETTDWKLSARKHLTKPEKTVERLIVKGKSGKTKSTSRVWNLLSPKIQKSLDKIYEEVEADKEFESDQEERGRRRVYRDLVEELNDIICKRDFYRPDDWGRFSITAEAKELLKDGPESLTEDQSRRLNRLLVSKAVPALGKPDGSTVTLYYWMFTYDPHWTFPASRSTVAKVFADVTSFFFDKILLSAGILIGILITANIVPQTFDPGSLNLLLSKPISRSGLYLARFFGGCSQVAICAAYLFFGTWLWLGLAVGLWDQAFLWSIPIYILVFAIYFSVSAFVGLLYRSPILSIVATVVFWAVCYCVGSSYVVFDAALQNERKYDPLVTDNAVMAIDGMGNGVQWNSTGDKWDIVAAPEAPTGPESAGITINQWFFKFKMFPYQMRPVVGPDGKIVAGLAFTFPPEPNGKSSHEAFVSSDEDQMVKAGDFPRNTMSMFSVKDGLVLANRTGKFGLWDPTESSVPKTTSLGPEDPVRLTTTYSCAMNSASEEIAAHQFADGQHSIVVFRRDGDAYVKDRSKNVDIGTGKKMKCYLAFAGDTILIVPGNNAIVSLDANTLEQHTATLNCETSCGIDTIATSPDGRWIAMMYANRNLWLMDVTNQTVTKASVTGQGNVSSVAFDPQNRLCVIDRESRLSVYQPNDLAFVENYSPSDGPFELAYRYLISPIYTVFPKPGEFYKVTSYMSSTRDTTADPTVDLIGEPAEQNPLLPLWSGLGFMVLMLTLSCGVFHFKDY